MIIAAHQIEIFAALGFRLLDEPRCGVARMAVCSVNRVPINAQNHALPAQRKARHATPLRPGKKFLEHELNSELRREAQR